ncbi:Fanconi anemia group J protein homolog isoform X2 [Trichoplusia ni]|uniref:Regulator of telomere elongation helicase 1 homolog n=1 Tax=Trichoplusia ni TaxID=7111 RepID=A0A7E5VH98_TRINI|nr:Fanconi anemia group J protein homolog isoform X2 [Trichoplusia ni]
MSANIEISDDDDSFNDPGMSEIMLNNFNEDVVSISSDEEAQMSAMDGVDEIPDIPVISDDDELPEVIEKKNKAIKSLFQSKRPKANRIAKKVEQNRSNITSYFAPKPVVKERRVSPVEGPKVVFNRMIEGVNVKLPVNPYGSQVALMSKIITAIKKGENCILESPTGSGKTLALLCGALAWQQHEQNRLSQLQAQQYFAQHPAIKKDGVADYISTPVHQKTDVTPEKLFTKNNFGEKSIYYKPENGETSSTRQEKTPYRENEDETTNLVNIHKRRRLGSAEFEDDVTTPIPSTPEKMIQVDKPETPESVSLPTIYYGARTHSQLKQVIKEFRRTSYCGEMKMTLLSSRDKSCIKELDRRTWSSKNDMCRACIKPQSGSRRDNTNCKYYDNRTAFTHNTLPDAFDLEDLVEIGVEREACPYYGARALAKTAHIVFCPYNYLIDPSIRSSLSISLEKNIVIIDEAHNIEGICRDVATVSITQQQIRTSLKELETVMTYTVSNQDVMHFIECLVRNLRDWNDWFEHQMPLVKQQPVQNNEAVHLWEARNFVNTLNNHNIGSVHYSEFKRNSSSFCRRLREDPRTLYGVTQATGTLLESLDMALGFMFRGECQYLDDYKPALVRHVTGRTNTLSDQVSWRSSNFNDWIAKDELILNLLCMNPGIVMEELQSARCIALASGTLTPLSSLHSELATSFPHCVSPNHVIPADRVWVGSLHGSASGPQAYSSAGLRGAAGPRALGAALLRVAALTPHGLLCFLPSYSLLDRLLKDWQETGLWDKLTQLKNVFYEKRRDSEHIETMESFYRTVGTDKGALLFAVYRGKVSEGMDFKDHQARAVVCVGIPYPNTFDPAVDSKMKYNDKYVSGRQLLSGKEWLRVQAYRALNQAVGRCVRHRGDWGAVLLVDSRYSQDYYTEHLSKWVKRFLGNNHHTYETLIGKNNHNSLESFMERMKIVQEEESLNA